MSFLRAASSASALLGLTLAACAGGDGGSPAPQTAAPPDARVVSCRDGTSASYAFLPGWRRRSVVAGPIAFAEAGEHGHEERTTFASASAQLRALRHHSRPDNREWRKAIRRLRLADAASHEPSEMLVVVRPGARVTVVVPAGERGRVALVYTRGAQERHRRLGRYRISDGDQTVTFEGCRHRVARFLGAFVVAGARCAPVDVFAKRGARPIRRKISFGAGRCEPNQYVPPGAPLAFADWQAPYMGVSCRQPNSIRCDRVGLAVFVRRSAARVGASIAGRRVTMRTGPFGPGRRGWEGFLQPAGLLSGPLRVRPDRGRYHWEGGRPVFAYVRLAVRYRDGDRASRVVLVLLSPGWG